MPWNWENPDWPQFKYDPEEIAPQERQFLMSVGSSCAFLKNIDTQEYNHFVVEILSSEGMESSRIEGEILDRESLQSSIKKHFGIQTEHKKETKKEARMAALLCSVYDSFDKPLSHQMLFQWHSELFKDQPHIEDLGKYRSHPEPMQIVSNRYGSQKVFFEAPPSAKLYDEMTGFIHWFNSAQATQAILGRAAIAHVYFESIHPFEDGNGRIGRLLVEKVLSQGVGRPILIAVSKILEKRKKEYYAALEKCNETLRVNEWVVFFANVILQAQEEAMDLLYFLIEKSKMLNGLAGKLNPRQEKVLRRMFAEGLTGFKGSLRAENYIAITQTSRATATRDLMDLVEMGALTKTGELRHTRYWLNIATKK
jgi:Fic family protein